MLSAACTHLRQVWGFESGLGVWSSRLEVADDAGKRERGEVEKFAALRFKVPHARKQEINIHKSLKTPNPNLHLDPEVHNA